MHFSIIISLVSTLAVITTILQFLSGILVCKQFFVNKTTSESSPLPFICGVLSSVIWLLYGLTKKDDKIILVNTVGVVLMLSYTLIFYIYTYKKSSVLRQVLCSFVFVLFIVGYASTEIDEKLLLNRLGLLACFLTLLTVAAPLSKLFHVLKVKNTECLPFPMILMSFFVSTLWFLYGMIIEDVYLLLPNFIGAVLAASQLSLFVLYSNNPQSPSLSKRIIA